MAAPDVLRSYLAQGSVVPGPAAHAAARGRPAAAVLPARIPTRGRARCGRRRRSSTPRTRRPPATRIRDPEPQAGKDTADSLNNRAVSLLDLGREAEADPLWGRALRSQPHHLEATYNQVLRDWQAGARRRRGDADAHGRGGEDARRRPRACASCWAACTSRSATTRRPRKRLRGGGRRGRALDRAVPRARPRALRAGRDRPDAAQPWVRATECLASAPCRRAARIQPRSRGTRSAWCAWARRRRGAGCYRQAAQQRRGLPAELQDAVARFLPGHEAGLRAEGPACAPAVAVVALTPDGRQVFATRRREHPRLGRRDRDVLLRTLARARRARARAGPDRRRHAPAVGRRGAAAAAPRPRDRTHAAVDAAPHGLRHGARHDARRHARGVRPAPTASCACGTWRRASACRRCRGHREAVTCVAVSADSATAASGSQDGTVRLWDLEDGPRGVHVRGPPRPGQRRALRRARPATWCPRARTARCTCGTAGAASRARRSRATGSAVTSLTVVRRRAALVVSGSQDRTVRAWDVARARLPQRLPRGVRRAGAGPRLPRARCGSRRARR